MAEQPDTAGPARPQPPTITTTIRVESLSDGSVELVLRLSAEAATDLALLAIGAAQYGRRRRLSGLENPDWEG